MPCIRLAEKGLERIRGDIKDYSCILVKRERVDGKLGEHEYAYMKVRQEEKNADGNITKPFAVYMCFKKPEKVKGREVIWVRGENNNKLCAHEGGRIMGMISVWLNPTDYLAMQGQRYPITEIGLENLIAKLLEVANHDKQYGECSVKFYKGSKINGRSCTCMEVVHPVPRKEFRFNIARIFIDEEMEVPIRFESYYWPEKKGEAPQLLEEYTYLNLELNKGFTDEDFNPKNPKYNFNNIR